MPNTIEQRAMQIVMKYEKKQGRNPKDVSRTKCGYDIQSSERYIEVKGMSSKNAGWFGINNSIVRNLGRNLANYWVYIVYDMKQKPKLKILEPDIIFKHLQIDTMFLLKTAVVNKYGKNVEI